MSEVTYDKIFLLEISVREISLNEELTNVVDSYCVKISLPDHNEPIEFCGPKNDTEWLRSRKTILFAPSCLQIDSLIDNFSMQLNVFQKLMNDDVIDEIPLGETVVAVNENFSDIVKTSEASDTIVSSVSQNRLDLKDAGGNIIGNIELFIRLTCFGTYIKQQFKLNDQDESMIYSGFNNENFSAHGKDDIPVRNVLTALEPDKLYNAATCQTNMFDCNYYDPYCLPYPQKGFQGLGVSAEGEKDYQEIGAEMNGNSLTVRILKHRNKSKGQPLDNARNPYGPAIQDQSRMNSNNTNANEENCNCCSYGDVKTVIDNENSPGLNFNILDSNGENLANLRAVPPKIYEEDGNKTVVSELSDPNKDVFLLRIAKKDTNKYKKPNLELELRTPKMPERKQSPKLETLGIQCNEEELISSMAENENGKEKSGTKKKVGGKNRRGSKK